MFNPNFDNMSTGNRPVRIAQKRTLKNVWRSAGSALGTVMGGFGVLGFIALWVIGVAASLALPITLVWVIWHFASKYW